MSKSRGGLRRSWGATTDPFGEVDGLDQYKGWSEETPCSIKSDTNLVNRFFTWFVAVTIF